MKHPVSQEVHGKGTMLRVKLQEYHVMIIYHVTLKGAQTTFRIFNGLYLQYQIRMQK